MGCQNEHKNLEISLYENINKSIKIIWFDENVYSNENKKYLIQLKSLFHYTKEYQFLNEGFENFYGKSQQFQIIIVIISGKLFGRYIKKIKENINKIINIPYTYIFTSNNFKNVLLQEIIDKEHILSYDTMIAVNDGFYNPGGVYDNFENLLEDIKLKLVKIESNIYIKPRIKDKINYEGVFTFEYLENDEELLAPALYKDIITNEKITLEHCKNFHKFILSFNEKGINNLIKNLDLFKYIPFEILSKYWARCYTFESDFYKILNNQLMNSQLPFNFKTYIKMLYTGIDLNSFKSYSGKLYRGSVINKIEIDKIKEYKNNGKLSNVVVFSKAFLSFSEDKNQALNYCGDSNDSKIGILFILENDNKYIHNSNANIQNFSVFPNEKEILFFPGSSFNITSINDMNNNKIEIILNYNGKFREKYFSIYEDQEKINNLIYNNVFTKNIAGKKLKFLKNGKYLVEENPIDYSSIFKGKNLETDEKIIIKQIYHKNSYNNEVNSLKILSKIKNSCKYIDDFQTEEYYYIVESLYDGNVYEFFEKNYGNEKERFKKPPLNLIKKIFNQLNEAFKGLYNNNLIHGDINPKNILIKFSNEEKTNFDSFLTGYDICEEWILGKPLSEAGAFEFMAPEKMGLKGVYKNTDLFSIGAIIYFFYFGYTPGDAPGLDFHFEDEDCSKIQIEEDKQLEDLLKQLLKENPHKRITWEKYFEHPFFKQYEY